MDFQDNSPEQNLNIDEFFGEDLTLGSPLYCNQFYNRIQRLAEQRKQDVFFMNCSDAKASPPTIETMLNHATELDHQGRKRGVLFTHYHPLHLFNTCAIRGIHRDRFLPLYYTDVGFYYRIKQADMEMIGTYVNLSYPAWPHYYIHKWGGHCGEEQYTTRFSR